MKKFIAYIVDQILYSKNDEDFEMWYNNWIKEEIK